MKTVEKFKNRLGNETLTVIVNNRTYSIELFDETEEERKNDFMFEYGSSNKDAETAFELLKEYF